MAKNGASRRVTVNTDDITFGIEIECTLPQEYISRQHIRIGSYTRGTQLPVPFPNGWLAKHDGSLSAQRYDYIPLEIVSPVLKGRAGLEEVLLVFKLLNEAGVEVNDSCGVHVHVGVQSVLGSQAANEGIVVRWVRRMLHLVSIHELGLLAITGELSRMGNCYCRSVTAKWDGKLTTTSPVDTIRREVVDHGERYYTLNLCNLFGDSKRTVEFRVFGATADGMQALGYIITAMGIAHRAAQVGTVPQFQSKPDESTPTEAAAALSKTLTHYGWPSGAKAAWGKGIRRAQQQAAVQFAQALTQREAY
jgi:hypothetical protein